MDHFKTNCRIETLLEIWRFSSVHLRKSLRSPAQTFYVTALAADLCENPIGHLCEPEARETEIPDEVFESPTPEEINLILGILHGLKLPEPTQILDSFGENKALDSIHKKTLARWEAFGEDAITDCVPIRKDWETLKREINPLLKELAGWIQNHEETIREAVRRHLKTAPAHDPNTVYFPPVAALESILTKSQIAQLEPELTKTGEAWSAPRTASNHDLMGETMIALEKKLNRFKCLFDLHEADSINSALAYYRKREKP